jgi:hypothetical protein
MGIFQARGEITFVYEGRSPLKASDLPRLWESRSWNASSIAAECAESADNKANEVIDAELVDAPRLGQARSRIRALRDEGRSGPPSAKITPRRRIRPRATR